MRAHAKDAISRTIFDLLAEDDESAAVALLAWLNRQTPALRAWLWEEFARSPKTRAEFRRLVESHSGKADSLALAHTSGEDRARAVETARLMRGWHGEADGRPYGGLSRPEIERWIRRYQAGAVHPGAFLLAHAWHKTAEGQPVSPALLRASGAFLTEALARGRTELLTQLFRGAEFLKEKGTVGRGIYGHAYRWKLSVLIYMLNHPKPAYRVRDLRAHLAGQRIKVNGKVLRRFCAEHGIARDHRAGRPRTRV
jgi:hypothetical protein